MKTLFPILILVSSTVISAQAQVGQSGAAAPAALTSAATAPSGATYSVVARGMDYRVWQRATSSTDALGRVSYMTNSYTELASGMNYVDPQTGQWTESQELVESFAGGAVARQGQHQVIFANDLATAGAIDMQTPDGKRLTSHILGLSYFNASTGAHVLIAEVTNCVGEILPPNQVIYENAFSGLKASVRYTYTRGGFEQDVILLEAPPPPAQYQLNPATTRLAVLTEFVNPPQPAIQTQVATQSDGTQAEDDTLDFGIMQVGSGKAFLLGPFGAGPGLSVSKQWLKLEGRDILVEQIPLLGLLKAIESLPKNQGASLNSPARTVRLVQGGAASPAAQPRLTASALRSLPAPKAAKADTNVMHLAKGRLPERGLVLDYFTMISTNTFTFQNDTTYYVSGSVNLSGTTTFEGGTVVKFAPTNTATLNVSGAAWLGSRYRPSIFTARDDNSVGQTINGSTGNPGTNFYGNPMLNLSGNVVTPTCVRISYAQTAINLYVASTFCLSHAQLVNCHTAFYCAWNEGTSLSLRNVLCYKVPVFGDGYTASLYGEHLTLNQVTNASGTLSCILTNSLVVASSVVPAYPSQSNACVGSAGGVFQTVGAASHYLADNSPYRNAGTVNINTNLLSDLKLRTTYPPIVLTNKITTDATLGPQVQRDTDVPDLGYHYDPLDYVVSGLTLTTTLVLTNGVALGVYGNYGIELGTSGTNNGKLVSRGLADRLNYIVHYNTVQEQSTTNWSMNSVGTSVYPWNDYASAQFYFTSWSIPGGSRYHFDNEGYSATACFQNCRFSGGMFIAYQSSAALTNCLWERVSVSFDDDTVTPLWYLQNNLFRGGSLTFNTGNSGTKVAAYNNLFDRTTIYNPYYTISNGHNAYVTNYSRLSGSQGNDQILTNNPVYQTSYLGNYYYPTNDGMLSTLINAGSTNANLVGLYHYTTQTNQVIEGATIVDIGFHYVATDNNGNPLDADGDGVPDYLEDANGNGVVDSGETDWQSATDMGLKVIITRPQPGASPLP